VTDVVRAFLFSDIVGSTRRWEEHRAAMSDDLRLHNDMINEIVTDNHGRVFKLVGDAVCAVFDSAAGAVQASIDAQVAIVSADWQVPAGIQVRMALHKGEVEEADGDYFGPTLNRIARLLSTCHGGQIVMSAEIVDEGGIPIGAGVEDLGSHSLKDLGQPMKIFQLTHSILSTDFPNLLTQDNQPNPTLEAIRGRVFPCFPVAVQAVIIDPDERILLLAHKRKGICVISGGLEAHESVLHGALRETAEEAGFAVRVRPLGVSHASSFSYDDRIKYMLDVYFVMAYEGGRVVPSDDMEGADVLWLTLDEIVSKKLELTIPPSGPNALSILRRSVALWRVWRNTSDYQLEPWLGDPNQV
jgi:class 3 adenylate cyclase/8-oxo-dGTP pyrophosphatase MutT (NUDIX family)